MAEINLEKEKALARLRELLDLQKDVLEEFGEDRYNVFVFGSYITTQYKEGISDIDIAVYSEDFKMYKRIAAYLEAYFKAKGIASDIFYIDTTVDAPVYCAPLSSKIQFTDYYPQTLIEFGNRCRCRLEENKSRVLV